MELRHPFRGLVGRTPIIWGILRRERVPHIVVLTLVVVLFGALGFFIFERGGPGQGGDTDNIDTERRISNSVWWSFVTIFTEGYGDYYPRTQLGRFTGVGLMFAGVLLISLLTATVASIMVERRIREGRGLQPTQASEHIIVCGWNTNAMNVLHSIATARGAPPAVVLVNELDEDEVSDIKYRFRGKLTVEFVSGDFTSETVLERAGLLRARGVLLLADVSGSHSEKEADERNLRATLAAKGMAPRVPICAEVIKSENERPLLRARADEVILRGCHMGFLMASSLMRPGVPQLLGKLLCCDSDTRIERVAIPPEFVGKTFAELAEHTYAQGKGILIGLVAESAGIDLDNILAGDMSSIDQFIRRKFAEAGQDLLDSARRLEVQVNPPPGEIIAADQAAIIISRAAAG